MQAHIGLGRIFGIDMGLRYSWFSIALLIMFWLSIVAGIETEAVDRRTKLLMGIKGKPCAAGVPGASMRIGLSLYPPLPQRV